MKGAGILLALLLLQYGFTALMLRVASGRWSILSQPITWLYSCWFLGLALLALPLYRYEESVTMVSGGLMLATLLAFSLGTVLLEFIDKKRSLETTTPKRKLPSYFIPGLLGLGVAGGALLILNAYLTGGLTLTERLDGSNAALIREAFMNSSESRIGPLFGPASTAYNLGFGALIIYAAYAGSIGWKAAKEQRLVFLASAAFVLTSSVFSIFFAGGRITIVLLILMASLAYYGGHKIRQRSAVHTEITPARRKYQKILISAITATLLSTGLWYSSTSFLENRTASAEPESLLFSTHRARFSEETEQIAFKSKDIGYALFTLSYISTPIPTYLYYLDLPKTRRVEPQWGQYSFPVIARYALRITGQFTPLYWDNARAEAFRPLADMNLGANVWATLNRDLLVDFGKVGTFVFMFALGVICQYIFKRERESSNTKWTPISALLKLLLLFSGLTSLLYMNQFAWPLYLCIAVLWYESRTTNHADPKHKGRP